MAQDLNIPVAGQVLEINGQVFLKDEEGNLTLVEMPMSLPAGTTVELDDNAFIRILTEDNKEIIFDGDNPEGIEYSNSFDETTTQEIADITAAIENDDEVLELEATAAGQGGQGGSQGATIVDNSDQETIATSGFDTELQTNNIFTPPTQTNEAISESPETTENDSASALSDDFTVNDDLGDDAPINEGDVNEENDGQVPGSENENENTPPTIGASTAALTEDAVPSVAGQITFSDVDNPGLAMVAETQAGTYGSLTIDESGNWVYTAGSNIDTLADGESQTETFIVTLSDGSTTTVEINLTGTDDAPEISNSTAALTEDAVPSVAGQITFSDVDNPGLAMVAETQAGTYGSLTIDESGNWVYTAGSNIDTLADGESQTETFTVTLNDGSTTTVEINLTGTDDAPEISSSTAALTEDATPSVAGQITFSDVDNPGLAMVAETQAGTYGSLTIDESGNWVYTAGNNIDTLADGESQTETFIVTLSDGSTTTVEINLTGTDDAPEISSSTAALTEDATPSVAGQITFSDVDNPGLAMVAETQAGTYGSLTIDESGNWVYTAGNNIDTLADGESQTETFIVTLSDGSTTTVEINLTGTDDAPVIGSAVVNVSEDDSSASGQLSASDVDNPALAFVAEVQNGTYGDLSIDASGNWVFTPNAAAQGLADAETQTETFTITLNDGSTTSITVNVIGADEAPVISVGSGAVIEDVTPTASGTLSATDADNAGLLFVAGTVNGTYGEVVIDANGNWTFTTGPGAQSLADGENVTETYTVTLNDGSTTTIEISLTGTDDAPVISSSTAALTEDAAPSVAGQINFSDVDNPGLAMVAETQAGTYGSLTIDESGNWVYTAGNNIDTLADGESQTETFIVTLSDGSTTTVEINLTGTDDAPVIGSAVVNVSEDDSSASGQLSASDVDNPALAFVAEVQNGTYGDLSIDASGNWVFTPNAAAQGLADAETQTETFTITLNDGSTTSITVNVIGADEAPVISVGSGAVIEDVTPTASGTLSATDADNAGLLFVAGTVNGTYGEVVIDANGNWTFTTGPGAQSLADGENVTETYTVTLNDGSTTTIEISLTGTDDAPVISSSTAALTEDAAPSVAGQINFSDVDNPGLAMVAETQAGTYGSLTIDESGNWVYTAGNNIDTLADGESQTETFIVTLSDGSTTTVEINLTGTDDAPVIGSAVVNVSEDDSSASGQLSASDVDNPALAFVAEVQNGTYGDLSIDASGNWVFTPNAAAQGLADAETQTETFTITLNDGSTTSITVNVIGADEAPVISVGSGAVIEDVTPTASGTLSATDADNAGLLFVAGTVNGTYGDLTVDANGVWSYSLNANAEVLAQGETGTDVITITLNDGSTTSVTITVTGTDDLPVISTGVGAVIEDVTPTISGNLTATDADNAGLLFVAGTVNGTYGDLTVDANGVWSYSLNANAEVLAQGETGTDVITITLNDGSTTSVTITVTGTDDLPVISTGVGAVIEDVTPTISGNLSATDADNAGLLFVAGTVNGTYGDLTVDANGVWSYSLNANAEVLAQGETGTDVITITLNDGSTTSVTITVTGTDDLPVISTGVGAVIEDVTPTISGNLSATDADNAGLLFVAGTVNGTYGDLTVDANGVWSYSLNANAEVLAQGETGTDVITITLNDGSTTSVTITVTGTDDLPVISTGVGAVIEDVTPTISGNLTAIDADNAGLLFVAGTVNGTYGDLTVDANGVWSYSLNANAEVLAQGETGTDVITITLNDGSTTSVTITVTGTDDLPVISTGVGAVIEGVTPTISGNLTATDADNAGLLFVAGTVNGTYGDLTVDANGVWSYSLNANAEVLAQGETGTDVITITLNDGSTTSVTITVTGTDDLPVISTGVGAVIENVTPTISGNLSATDADNAGLLFVAGTVNGTYGDLTVDANGVWSYSLNANAEVLAQGETGTDVITITLNDGSTTSVTITVTGTDDLPVISTGVGAVIENVTPTISGNLSATDADNAGLLFVAGTVNGTYGDLTVDANGVWSYSLNANAEVLAQGETGTDVITITLNDGSTTSVTITVTGTDDLPVISTGVGAVIEDVTPTISGNLTATDADNAGLLFVAGTVNGTYGDLTVDANGVWSYSLNANAEVLAQGETGTDVITITLNDGSTTSVTITVTGTDDLPVISTGVGAVIEDVTPTISGNLSATDADNAGLLFVAGTVNGTYGDLTVDANGVWSYSLNANAEVLAQGETGTDVITITLNDGSTTSVTITVTGTDDLPVISTGVGAVIENVTPTISGNLSATDADNAGLLFVAGTVNGTYGDLTVDANGVWSYSLNANAEVLAQGETGTDVITITLNDGSTTSVTITVTGTDDLPVISTGVGAVIENVTPTISGNLSATDADNAGLLFVAGTVNGTYGDLTVDANGVWSYSLNANAEVLAQGETGTDVITITLNDGSTTSVTITVTGTDDLPVISTGVGAVIEDVTPTISGNLTATDADNAGLLFVAGTVNGTYGDLTVDANGVWSYSLNANAEVLAQGETGTDVITITLNDGSTTSVTITVTGTDDLPVISTGVGELTEDLQTVLAGKLEATDPDNVGLLFVSGTIAGLYGDLSIDANGLWVYTLNANAQLLGAGEQQNDVFLITLNDGSTTNITLTVNGTDDSPIVSSGSGSISEDAVGALSGLLTATDSDDLGLTFEPQTVNGLFGTFILSAGGSWTYSVNTSAQFLNAGETGTEVFMVRLSDGSTTQVSVDVIGSYDSALTLSVLGLVTSVLGITVDGINSLTTALGTVITDALYTVAGELPDPNAGDGSILYVATEITGEYGTLIIDASGAWNFIVRAGANLLGVDETQLEVFSLPLSDGSFASIQLSVTGTLDVPVVGTAVSTLVEDILPNLTGEVEVNDPSNGSLAVVAVTLTGLYGTLILALDGTWDYTLHAGAQVLKEGEIGNELFNIPLNDGNTMELAINVLGKDDAPIISLGVGSVIEDTLDTVTGVLTAGDIDNDTLAFIACTVAGNFGDLTIDALGAWTYVLNDNAQALENGEIQQDVIVLTLSDGSQTTVTINVTGTAEAPVAIAPVIMDEDSGPYTLDVSNSFADILLTGNSLSVTVLGSTNLIVNVDAFGIATITPILADWNGSENITLEATTPLGLTISQTFSITVRPVVDIADDNISINEDTPTIFNVLANDSFENVLPIVTISSLPNHGIVVVNIDGTILYTPDLNYAGPDSFEYTVTSGGVTETATVNVDVQPVNDPLVALATSISLNEDSSHIFSAGDFLYSDTENDLLAVVKITVLPVNGLLTLNGIAVALGAEISMIDIDAGLLIFTPEPDQFGLAYAQIGIELSDNGIDFSAGVLVTLNVNDVVDADSSVDINTTSKFASVSNLSEKNSEVSNVDADSNLSAKVINLVTPNESISINDQAEIFKFVSADTGDVNNFVINDLSSEVNLDEALEKFDLSDLLQVENSGSNDPLSSYLKVSSDGSDTKISVDANSNGQTDSEITLKGVDLMGLYGSEDIIKSLFDQTTTKDF